MNYVFNQQLIFFLFSTYGHILQMAETVAEGVRKSGAECDIYQIPETLPEEILEKMHAPPKVHSFSSPLEISTSHFLVNLPTIVY